MHEYFANDDAQALSREADSVSGALVGNVAAVADEHSTGDGGLPMHFAQ